MLQKGHIPKVSSDYLSEDFFPFCLSVFSEFFLEYIFTVFEIRRKEACTKSSTMEYILYWKCAQYSEEAANLSGEVKENLATSTFLVLHLYMSFTFQPNAMHGVLWILVQANQL